ncbi:MAG: oligosaccharide flippase family protein, partial [Solirubrobacteraceae bacterium]
ERVAVTGSEPPAVADPVPADSLPKDPGAARNTLLQLASQLGSAVFTAGLTLYLVRALGASNYGIYALAVSLGALMLFPAGLGLPLAIGRFIADHWGNAGQIRAIFRVGLRMQLISGVVFGLGLFAASGLVADAYGEPGLGWPLRWVALSVIGQALFAFLASAGASVRRLSVSLWMSIIESVAETSTAIVLVVAGAGAAGAAAGKAFGYTVATVAGLFLTVRLLGGRRRGERVRLPISLGAISRYAGAMFVVDVTWSAISQVDVLLIGAVLTTADVGSFGAVLRVLTVLGYLGTAVASGVAPRLSLAGGKPDARPLEDGIRYLVIVQGLAIAPMIVWATPITHLLLGDGYRASAQIMRALTPYYFISAPAALITLAVTYLGEARRRVVVMLATLAFGLVATYVLLEVMGVVGAAVADDLMLWAYVGAHLWICADLITLDLARLAWSLLRTVLAAGAMALVLLVIGTRQLSLAQWLVGALGGTAAFAAGLLVTRELSLAEIRNVATRLRAGALGAR